MTQFLRLSLPFLFVICQLACVTTPSSNSQRLDQPGPLLWKVTKGDKTAYIFGTIHYGVTADQLAPIVWQTLNQAKTVVLEIDIAATDHRAISNHARIRSNQTLDQQLGSEHWLKLVTEFAGVIPGSALRELKPATVYTLWMRKTFPKHISMDMVIYGMAQRDKKTVIALETIEDQLKALDSFVTIPTLKLLIDHPTEVKTSMDSLVSQYKTGNLNKIYQQIIAPDDGGFAPTDEQVDIIINQRNKKWMTTILSHFSKTKDPFLVAVGCGHLAGDFGLLALLEKKGFSVVRHQGD